MKFNDYPTLFEITCQQDKTYRKAGYEAFYRMVALNTGKEGNIQAFSERNWYVDHQAYYNVWPVIMSSFEKINLDKIPTASISYPRDSITLRMPVDSRLGVFTSKGQEFHIRSLLVANLEDVFETKGAAIYIDIGEIAKDEWVGNRPIDIPVASFRVFPVGSDIMVSESIKASDGKVEWSDVDEEKEVWVPRKVWETAFKIYAFCGLLDEDSKLIIPDVLNKDKKKFDPDNPSEIIIQRAHRRGKVGWDVGEELERMEMSPHFRMPHPAIYRVGPGRKKTVIRFRSGDGKGSPILVRKDKITKLPTGEKEHESDS